MLNGVRRGAAPLGADTLFAGASAQYLHDANGVCAVGVSHYSVRQRPKELQNTTAVAIRSRGFPGTRGKLILASVGAAWSYTAASAQCCVRFFETFLYPNSSRLTSADGKKPTPIHKRSRRMECATKRVLHLSSF